MMQLLQPLSNEHVLMLFYHDKTLVESQINNHHIVEQIAQQIAISLFNLQRVVRQYPG